MEHISKHLVVTESKNAVQVQTEWKLQNAGKEEKQLAVCLTEQRICTLTDIEPVSEALRYAMTLIGLRANNWPDQTEKALLLNFIVNNFGGHTAGEIRLAFDMAVSGAFDVEVNCYENFSVLYFSNIMNAYREWAKEAAKHVQPKPVALLEYKFNVSDAEFIQGVFTLYSVSRNYRQIPMLAYKVMEPQLKLTREEKKRIYAIVREEYPEGDIRDLCGSYAVKEFFDRLLNPNPGK